MGNWIDKVKDTLEHSVDVEPRDRSANTDMTDKEYIHHWLVTNYDKCAHLFLESMSDE